MQVTTAYTRQAGGLEVRSIPIGRLRTEFASA
jgi:hypothetical protein